MAGWLLEQPLDIAFRTHLTSQVRAARAAADRDRGGELRQPRHERHPGRSGVGGGHGDGGKPATSDGGNPDTSELSTKSTKKSRIPHQGAGCDIKRSHYCSQGGGALWLDCSKLLPIKS